MNSMRGKCSRGTRGFTLVELMVSLGVVSVLAAVAIPTVNSYIKLARKVDCQMSIVHFIRAQEMYYLDNNKFFAKKLNKSYTIAWNDKKRPDKPDKYRFEELGVEFRPDSHRGYRITVLDYQLPSLFWQELRLEVKTDENFKNDGATDYYSYQKYNWQLSFGKGKNKKTLGSEGKWWVSNQFWFDIHGCPAWNSCP